VRQEYPIEAGPMNRTWRYIRFSLTCIPAGAAIYLFVLIYNQPEKPKLPFLEDATKIVSDFFQRIRKKPILYPSQIHQIQSYLKELNSELCEGFAQIKGEDPGDAIVTYRWPVTHRKTTTWIERNNQIDSEVSWLTASPSKKYKTTFIFSGALGAENGQAQLFLLGEPILAFQTGKDFHRNIWNQNGCELRFFPLLQAGYFSGIFCLTVPENYITEGGRSEIAVSGIEGMNNHSYFALHKYNNLCKILGYD